VEIRISYRILAEQLGSLGYVKWIQLSQLQGGDEPDVSEG
jgi:hypothetical protein